MSLGEVKLPRNRSDQDIIDHRREVVAMLRLRGMTIRGIVEELPKYQIINEKRGKPWSRKPVHDDLLALAKEWQEAAAAHTDDLKGNILAEIREVRRAAWEGKELKVVLAALEDERKLLGMDAAGGVGSTSDMPAHTVNYTPEQWLAEQKRRRDEAEATEAMFADGNDDA